LVVLLYYIYPLLVTVGGSFLFHEQLGHRQLTVIALGLGGIAMTVGAPNSTPAAGIALGLVAGLCAAAFVLGARQVMSDGSLEPVETLALMLTGPAIGFTVASVVRGFAVPSASGSACALGLVVLGTVVAPLLFFSAVPKIGAGTTSLLASVEPFVTVVLAYAILHEGLTALQLCGGALILAAVAALSLPSGSSLRLRRAAAGGSSVEETWRGDHD
jgi:drug/metabolite transporter (DMT)-like permease